MRCLLAGADHGPDGSFPEMGTWLGVNQAGMAVAVTNRHDGELAWADQVRSRGLLAVRLLGDDRPEHAARVRSHRAGAGWIWRLQFPDRRPRMPHSSCRPPEPARVSVIRLEPGIHAMTNLDLDDDDDPRIRLVRATLEPGDFIASAAAPLPRRPDRRRRGPSEGRSRRA